MNALSRVTEEVTNRGLSIIHDVPVKARLSNLWKHFK